MIERAGRRVDERESCEKRGELEQLEMQPHLWARAEPISPSPVVGDRLMVADHRGQFSEFAVDLHSQQAEVDMGTVAVLDHVAQGTCSAHCIQRSTRDPLGQQVHT